MLQQQPLRVVGSLEASVHVGRLMSWALMEQVQAPERREGAKRKRQPFPPSPSDLDCHMEVLPVVGGVLPLSVYPSRK